jgi:hypothetical protein
MAVLANDLDIVIAVGNSSSVSIKYERNEKKILIGFSGAPIDENMMALVNVICHSIRAMSKNVTLDRYFNPYSNYGSTSESTQASDQEDTALYAKVEWTRAGYLKRRGWIVRPFKHAETVSEALSRSGVFSCPEHLVDMLPIKKPDEMLASLEVVNEDQEPCNDQDE